ncbi:hypothetical protein H7347_07920 [Corynebacterium sp. zg-331]|uniref:hypothetical protein n=1 Tax=unclassified Corynebacterium TaxID=2624378 RepID=UPI00128B2F07|nr:MULTISPECIES: hypothetical protein [unclassified Corynebacterium]MBC3186494.1 hypothetical protein [Corynebacterium sp. zg-331]MPV52979.1 hypothetical protein [Corynebacterium sp. zg331]
MMLPGLLSRAAPRRAVGTVILGAATALCSAFPLAPSASADILPLSPTAEASRELWANPLVRPEEDRGPVRVTLLGIDGAIRAHLEPGQQVRLRLRLRNVSDAPVTQLSLQLRRAAAVDTVAQARQALAQDLSTYTTPLSPLTVPGPLAPGEEREVELRAATDPGAGESLALEPDSAYPLAVVATADADPPSTERFVVDTNPRPRLTPAAPEDNDSAEPGPQGLSLLYPLSEATHIVPGETGEAPEPARLILSEDSLARSLSAGGRLHELLDAYEQALVSAPVAESTCLALDPALLSAVSRMQDGYTVAPTRHRLGEPTRRLRDSWGSRSDAPSGSPGAGGQPAREWLARLSRVAAGRCVVALPWANADLDAVQRTANPWLMREALQRGQEVISRVVGVQPQRGVVIPGSGYVSEVTVPALAWADQPGDLTEAWEASATAGGRAAGEAEHGSDSTLDSPALPDAAAGTHPQPPQQPVSVLVADNTVWSAPEVDRFAQIGTGIRAVTYPASLAATLAATGEDPATAGYSNPEGRFDLTLDSAAARRVTAAAAVRRSVARAREEEQPTLVAPPAALDAETGAMLLAEVESALSSGEARPMTLGTYLTPDDHQAEELAALSAAAVPPTGPRLGAPFLDPSAYSDAEVLRTTQQANYTDDLTGLMTNDPSIALTRYAFTAPLRQDLLAALSTTRRRSMASFHESVAATSRRLGGNREVLQDLRGSVTLLPPGNVYTRTSDSSPLLIVAKNGLPLPVDATMLYHTAQGARITVPTHLRIPARGSITVNMTANISDEDEQAQMDLWLASSDGSAISDPVRIAVQTRASLVGVSALFLSLGGLLAAAVLFRLGRRRR